MQAGIPHGRKLDSDAVNFPPILGFWSCHLSHFAIISPFALLARFIDVIKQMPDMSKSLSPEIHDIRIITPTYRVNDDIS